MVFPKWNQNVPWSKHGGCGLWSIHPMPSESPRDSWHSSTPERFPASPRYMARPPGRTAGKKNGWSRTGQTTDVGMDQYLLIPLLVGWTSIFQLFWCSLGTRVLTHPHVFVWWLWAWLWSTLASLFCFSFAAVRSSVADCWTFFVLMWSSSIGFLKVLDHIHCGCVWK